MTLTRISEKDFAQLRGHAARRPWLIIFATSLFFMYHFAQVNMFNALGPAMLKSFHIDVYLVLFS